MNARRTEALLQQLADKYELKGPSSRIPAGEEGAAARWLALELEADGTPVHKIEAELRRLQAHCTIPLDEGLLSVIVENMQPATPTFDDGARAGELPEINISEFDTMPALAGEAWRALVAVNQENPRLFRHGDHVIRIRRDSKGVLLLSCMTTDSLKYELERAARWVKNAKTEGVVPCYVPACLVNDLAATPEAPLPTLHRIALTPTFAADGTIVARRGFHARPGIFYDGSIEFNDLAATPTENDVRSARELLLEIVSDFPFTTEADRANAIALLVLPFARGLFDGPSPLHLIEKPTQGTGATLIAQAFAIVATGRDLMMITEGGSDEEWRKRITSTLLESPSIICIDNLHRFVDSAALSAALTSTTWNDRRLGKSENVSPANLAAWCATANNPTVSGEIARRTVSIRLDARLDRPWERDPSTFRHPNLISWVRERRGDLVRAVVRIIQSWLAAGRPDHGVPTLGSYESWARCIGGILTHAGIEGFLGNAQRFYSRADVETEGWRALVKSWYLRHADAAITVTTIGEIAASVGLSFGGKTERAEVTRLGKALRAREDCVLGDWRIEFSGRGKAGVTYRVRAVNAGSMDDVAPVTPNVTPPELPLVVQEGQFSHESVTCVSCVSSRAREVKARLLPEPIAGEDTHVAHVAHVAPAPEADDYELEERAAIEHEDVDAEATPAVGPVDCPF